MSNSILRREDPILSPRVTRTDRAALQNFFANSLVASFPQVKLVESPLFWCYGRPTDPDDLQENGWGWAVYIGTRIGDGRTPYHALKDAYFRKIIRRDKHLFWEQLKAYQRGGEDAKASSVPAAT